MLNAGIVAATMINANPWRDRNAPAVSPLDFLPPGSRPERQPEQSAAPQSLDDQIAILAAAFGCGPKKMRN